LATALRQQPIEARDTAPRCNCHPRHLTLAEHREHARRINAGKGVSSPLFSVTEDQLIASYMAAFAQCPVLTIERQDEFFAKYGQRRGDDQRVSA